MRRVDDRAAVEAWVEKARIRQCFSTQDLPFALYRYQKGEQITAPGRPLNCLLFVVEGTIRIYGLRRNGTVSPVNQQKAPTILGDLEFSTRQPSTFFTEAVTAVTCVALPVRDCERQLHSDIRFLHVLLHTYAEKLQRFALVDAPAETIEERVLLYLRDLCPTHELAGVEAAVLQLRCSRRQLQRVLRKLCDEGRMEHTGKGRYRLLDLPPAR